MYLEFDGFSKSQPEKCNKDRHFVIIDSRIRFYTSISVRKHWHFLTDRALEHQTEKSYSYQILL